MNGAPADFWGKREPYEGEVQTWHPLIDHCADVAACAATLLDLPTWRRRLARLCGKVDLDEVTRARLSVLAALHDIGKFNIGFQAKGRPEFGVKAGHVREALTAIGQPVFSCLEPLGVWGEGTTGLLASAICHHGRPYAFRNSTQFEPVLWTARGGLDPKTGVEALLDRCRIWFPAAFDAHDGGMPEHPSFEHGYAGLVMLADWIGSDTRVFRYSNSGEQDRMSFALSAATWFVTEGWLKIKSAQREDSQERSAFARVAPPKFAREPNPAQAAILSLPADDPSSVSILESETGSGKTEAALARFVTLFSAGIVDGLYFALPTRSAATQMYRRVHDAVQRAFRDPPPVVFAVPGYIRVDDTDAKKLPRFQVLWPDEGRFRYRGWAGEAPKRFLSGCIVVGTIDQVLLSALRVGHAHLRATALLRQLLVVDEVHASDAYMSRILEEVLTRHTSAGGHSLLLSATLGAETRCRFLSSGATASVPTLDEAMRAPYPLISHRGGSVKEITPNSEKSNNGRLQGKSIGVSTMARLEDVDSVATAAINAAIAGAKVLIIKNTVADCIATQRAVERLAEARQSENLLFSCNGIIAPHHARFARADREALDGALEEKFGSDMTRPGGGCIAVATQTVQQSLDLDTDFMLTDLCPMDVLLQRIGRLHRHVRERPSGFEAARVIVIVPADRDLGVLLGDEGKARHHHGLGSVYEDLRILEATWRLVEGYRGGTWSIPANSRELVEQSLHSTVLNNISAENGSAWLAHAQRMMGKLSGERRQADLNLVDWTQPYSETSFSDDGLIPTRLGEGDRRVQFDLPFQSPFGKPVDELVVRASWVSGVASDEYAGRVLSVADGIIKFEFANKIFIYDRHGLQKA